MSLEQIVLLVFLVSLGCALLGWLAPYSSWVAAASAFLLAIFIATGRGM